MEEKQRKIEQILDKNRGGEKLVENLDNYINESKFKDEIDKYVRNNLMNKDIEEISADEIYNLIYNYVSEHLPSDIQERVFYDIRKYVDENINDFSELND